MNENFVFPGSAQGATLLRHGDLFGSQGFHIAETVLPSDGSTFLHTHDFCEVFLVTEGQLAHQVNGREVPMAQGSIGLVLPQDVHCYRRTGGRPAKLVNVAFTEALFSLVRGAHAACASRAAEDLSNRHSTNLPGSLTQALLLRINYLVSHVGRMFQVDDRQLLTSILMDFFTLLDSAGEEPLVPHWLARACEEIQQDQRFTGGIAELVALSGKSQEHLTREMKRFYGITPSAFINGLRLDYAAHLLRTTGHSVLDILLECGFGNVSHFNTQFKKMFGMSPTQYRRQNSLVVSSVRIP